MIIRMTSTTIAAAETARPPASPSLFANVRSGRGADGVAAFLERAGGCGVGALPYPSARGTQGMLAMSMPSSARASASSGEASP
jgi:hypothetical protein